MRMTIKISKKWENKILKLKVSHKNKKNKIMIKEISKFKLQLYLILRLEAHEQYYDKIVIKVKDQ